MEENNNQRLLYNLLLLLCFIKNINNNSDLYNTISSSVAVVVNNSLVTCNNGYNTLFHNSSETKECDNIKVTDSSISNQKINNPETYYNNNNYETCKVNYNYNNSEKNKIKSKFIIHTPSDMKEKIELSKIKKQRGRPRKYPKKQ
ncbi:hypothetical protein ABK040_013064 [Willaertia magna]